MQMSFQEIIPYLEKLTKSEYQEYFLIINPENIDDVYTQFIPVDSRELYCEVVSNIYLTEKYQLEPNQITKLQSLVFSMGDDTVNYSQIYKVNNEFLIEALAKLVIKIFVEIFGIAVHNLMITFDSQYFQLNSL